MAKNLLIFVTPSVRATLESRCPPGIPFNQFANAVFGLGLEALTGTEGVLPGDDVMTTETNLLDWLCTLVQPRPPMLTRADYEDAARECGCESAVIRAVTEVEAGSGGGFLPSGRPKILFEAHIFSRLTNHQYDQRYSSISSRRWNKALYLGNEREYQRLEAAAALDFESALKAASWGLFQILGTNFEACGHVGIREFVEAHCRSEREHLQAFLHFIRNQRMLPALRAKNWEDFARSYNGPGFAKNHYDHRLAKAYRRSLAAEAREARS